MCARRRAFDEPSVRLDPRNDLALNNIEIPGLDEVWNGEEELIDAAPSVLCTAHWRQGAVALRGLADGNHVAVGADRQAVDRKARMRPT